MTFLFDSQFDSYHIASDLHFQSATCGQVRLDIGAENFRYDVLLADSKMTTFSCVSAAHYDVHHVSTMALSIRWCQSTSMKA
jgi:hypothetical protein